MSRIGKKPIEIPTEVTVKLDGQFITVKGPKGELSYKVHPRVKIEQTDSAIILTIEDIKNKKDKALWGTNRQLVAYLITGVSVEFEIPENITAKVEKNLLTLESIDKQLIGETAAKIRKIKKPEPYKGKGIKYIDEVIIRKAGKQVKSGGE